jgi:hypothetical protein
MVRTSMWGMGGVAVLAAACGLALNSPAPAQQPGATSLKARCEDAARQMHALFVQIKGLEGVLNRRQDDMNAAKGTDARLDAAIGMINELSDSRVKIREKEEAVRDLLVGHMLEHLNNKSSTRDMELQTCPLFKDLHRSVDQQVERGDEAQQRDRSPQPKK